MPPVVVVTRDKKLIGRASLGQATFIIGRSGRCDLCLDDDAVSRRHALIGLEDGRYTVSDRKSRNGTLLNGKSVKAKMHLHDGDAITVGPFVLRFFEDASESAAPSEDGAETHWIGERQGGAVHRKRAAGRWDVRLVAIEGVLRGTEYKNWEGPLTIGRSTDCAVFIPDESVSRPHARISEDSDGFVIENLSDANGTFVDGKRVEKHRLEDGQRIRIGTSTFRFSQVDPARRRFVLRWTAAAVGFVLLLLAVVVKLMPEDQCGKLVSCGQERMRAGAWQEALDYFQKALVLDPERSDAKQGIAQAKKAIETAALLGKALQAAEREQFDEAKDTCYAVLRQDPGNSEGRKLEAVLQAIGDARTALDARNWPDAVRLLQKASKTYPGSSVIRSLMERATAEATAQTGLAKAGELISNNRRDDAMEVLHRIPKTSLYYPEAVGLIDKMEAVQSAETAFQNAQAAYRSGNLGVAAADARRGLELAPDNAKLQGITNAIARMEPLVAELDRSSDAMSSDKVKELRHVKELCGRIVDQEKDPGNAIRQRASQTEAQVSDRLRSLADKWIQEAATHLQAGNNVAALQVLERAQEASPTDERIGKVIGEVRTRITDVCRKHFQEGMVREELGQTDLAAASYQAVLKAAAPGDSYYERAREKLKRLQK